MTDKQFNQIMRGVSVIAAELYMLHEKAYTPPEDTKLIQIARIEQLADAFEHRLMECYADNTTSG
jgi:hypothetical protein